MNTSIQPQLSPARLEQWRAACTWLAGQRFQRVSDLNDIPEAFRELFQPENAAESLALGLVSRTMSFWQLRPDVEVKLAYYAGDPETVAGLNAVRERLERLADRLVAQAETIEGLLTLERGTPSRWDTDWAAVARGQRAAMERVSVFALRGYVSEIARAVRELRRTAGIGG